jgi:hypothetical protein
MEAMSFANDIINEKTILVMENRDGFQSKLSGLKLLPCQAALGRALHADGCEISVDRCFADMV